MSQKKRNIDSFIYHSFASRLTDLRRKNGLTQVQAAAAISVSSGQWQKYEYGTTFPEIDTLVSIADYFGVSVDYLLGRSTAPALDLNEYRAARANFAPSRDDIPV
jgi:transcriptional regulator with XRE-family HTH domain